MPQNILTIKSSPTSYETIITFGLKTNENYLKYVLFIFTGLTMTTLVT